MKASAQYFYSVVIYSLDGWPVGAVYLRLSWLCVLGIRICHRDLKNPLCLRDAINLLREPHFLQIYILFFECFYVEISIWILSARLYWLPLTLLRIFQYSMRAFGGPRVSTRHLDLLA